MYSNEDVVCISSAYTLVCLVIVTLFGENCNGDTKLFSIRQKAVIVLVTLNKGTSHG